VSCCNSFFHRIPLKKAGLASLFVAGAAAFGGWSATAFVAASVAYGFFRGPLLYNAYQDWTDPEYSLSLRADAFMRGFLNADQLPEGLGVVEALAINGDAAARLQFGTVLMNGFPGTGRAFQNPELAFSFYKFAETRIEDERLKAVICWNLAMCHYFGMGTEKNLEKAQEAFRAFPTLKMLSEAAIHPFAFQPKVPVMAQKEALLALCPPQDRAEVEASLQNFNP
jgi:hypothetical protein